jgi:hypothetical protein
MFRKKNQVDKERINQALRVVKVSHPIQPKDMRTCPRIDSWLQCVISSDERFRISAIMIDHAEGGARIRFRSHESLPNKVTLIVPALGINRTCNVAWRERGDAGLQFT